MIFELASSKVINFISKPQIYFIFYKKCCLLCMLFMINDHDFKVFNDNLSFNEFSFLYFFFQLSSKKNLKQ